MSDERDDKPTTDQPASIEAPAETELTKSRGRRSEPTNPQRTVDVSDGCMRAAKHIAGCPACFAAISALIVEKAVQMTSHGGEIQH